MISGILLLDKPTGLSSNHALQRAKRAFGADKAGHTGTLDPLATGMLPICFGEATKVAGYVLGNRKAYRATLKLGAETNTYDSDGEVTATHAVPALTQAVLVAALRPFTGTIEQRPPAFCALKKDGVPMYKLARRGIDVEAPVRAVEIDRIDLAKLTGDEVVLDVVCGSGTYIRSLAHDLGRVLGCGAHLTALRRLWVEPFEAGTMLTLADVQAMPRAELEQALLPVATGLQGLPQLALDADEVHHLRHGRTVQRPGSCFTGAAAAHDPAGALVGIVERDVAGTVRVKRLIHLAPERATAADPLTAAAPDPA